MAPLSPTHNRAVLALTANMARLMRRSDAALIVREGDDLDVLLT